MSDMIDRAIGGTTLNESVKALQDVFYSTHKGKWIEHKSYPGLAYLCSECGYFTTDRSNFCPHCGKKMGAERRTDAD